MVYHRFFILLDAGNLTLTILLINMVHGLLRFMGLVRKGQGRGSLVLNLPIMVESLVLIV